MPVLVYITNNGKYLLINKTMLKFLQNAGILNLLMVFKFLEGGIYATQKS